MRIRMRLSAITLEDIFVRGINFNGVLKWKEVVEKFRYTEKAMILSQFDSRLRD